MEGSAGPTEGAGQPSPAELTPNPVGLCASTALHRPGQIRLSWRSTSVCLTALEQGTSCVVGMRTEPAELCCGFGLPNPGSASQSAPSRGDARGAGSGQAGPPSPRGSPAPAHGESRGLPLLRFEGFDCGTELKIQFFCYQKNVCLEGRAHVVSFKLCYVCSSVTFGFNKAKSFSLRGWT